MKNEENKKSAETIGNETKTSTRSKWGKRFSRRGLGKSFWGSRSGLFSSRSPSAHWSSNLNLN